MTQMKQNAFTGNPFACLLLWLLRTYGCVLCKKKREGGRKRGEEREEKPSLVPSSKVNIDVRIMISS